MQVTVECDSEANCRLPVVSCQISNYNTKGSEEQKVQGRIYPDGSPVPGVRRPLSVAR